MPVLGSGFIGKSDVHMAWRNLRHVRYVGVSGAIRCRYIMEGPFRAAEGAAEFAGIVLGPAGRLVVLLALHAVRSYGREGKCVPYWVEVIEVSKFFKR